MKRLRLFLFAFPLLTFLIPFAHAQTAADVAIGFGANHVSAGSSGIDNANSPNAFGACTPGPSDPFCQSTPGLNGFFLGFSGDAMLTKKYGVGGEISFLPAKGNYGPLLFRETFFDVNGILAPVHEKRVMVKLMGGIGIAKTGFSINEGGCVGSVVCTNQVVPVGSATHFQLHGAAGVEFMVTQNLFVRPQFDVRYIPSLTDQFGSDFVPGGMLWIGFRLGGH